MRRVSPLTGGRRRRVLAVLAALAGLWAVPALAGHGAGGLVPSYSVEHVRRMMEAGEPVILVDLRPPSAYRNARLPGARSIPLAELERRLGEIPRSGRVVLYGETIVEASQGHGVLQDRGYRNAAVLEDGFGGWVKRGFPLEPGR